MAYDAAAFIRYVVKGHIKKNRPSVWSDMPRDAFARAVTRKRRTSIRTFLVGVLLAVASAAFSLVRVLLGTSLCLAGASSTCSPRRWPERASDSHLLATIRRFDCEI